MRESLIEFLDRGFQLGVRWSDESGEMADPYENDRPENFAPPCWCVISAGLYRLTGREDYLGWTERWVNRTALLLEGYATTSPVLREYLLGYAAQIFPILDGHLAPEKLAAWRQAFARSNAEEVTDLYESHVSATALNCDLHAPLGREEAAAKRSQRIIGQLKGRLTETNFLKDDDVGGNSIAHIYLTGSLAASVLLVTNPGSAEREVMSALERICCWSRRANGDFAAPIFANRSMYSFFGYGTAAHLVYAAEGPKAAGKVKALFDFVRPFYSEGPEPSLTPTYLSPYAQAGLEWTFNRLNTDVGAGLVGWTHLALLMDRDWPGFESVHSTTVEDLADEEAGYAVHHGPDSRLAITLMEHDWRYHCSLQPVSLHLEDDFIEPIIPAKREGQKHHHYEQFEKPEEVDPFVEPYFGVAAKKPIDVAGRKNWWANAAYRLMTGKAQRVADKKYRITESLDVSLAIQLDRAKIRLDYEVQGLEENESAVFSLPVLLWDGKSELRYTVEGSKLGLEWNSKSYQVKMNGANGSWLLHVGRHFNSGLGVTDNFLIDLEKNGRKALATLTIERT